MFISPHPNPIHPGPLSTLKFPFLSSEWTVSTCMPPPCRLPGGSALEREGDGGLGLGLEGRRGHVCEVARLLVSRDLVGGCCLEAVTSEGHSPERQWSRLRKQTGVRVELSTAGQHSGLLLRELLLGILVPAQPTSELPGTGPRLLVPHGVWRVCPQSQRPGGLT